MVQQQDLLHVGQVQVISSSSNCNICPNPSNSAPGTTNLQENQGSVVRGQPQEQSFGQKELKEKYT